MVKLHHADPVMSTSDFDTTNLKLLVERIQQGECAARNELMVRMQDRLERLAHRMLRDYPSVGRWVETDDVMQNASLRLLSALSTAEFNSTSSLFALAAKTIRCELIDMARHFHRLNAKYKSGVINPNQPVDAPDHSEPATSDSDGDDLLRWEQFHLEVAELEDKDREVFGLIYYHGLTRQQVADVFQCNERTVRGCWRRACLTLKGRLHGQWADPE